MKSCKLGIIGLGNMGMAIAEGALRQNVLSSDQIGIFEHRPANIEKAKTLGMRIFENEVDCAENCDLLMLSIKPQGFPELMLKLQSIKQTPVILSIAAGIPIATMQKAMKNEAIIRAMPNTPLLIGQGATALCKSAQVPDELFQFTINLFQQLGEVCLIEEHQMNAIIPISGSTPAYVYYFIDCLAKDGVQHGLDYNLALRMAAQTFIGAAQLLKEDGKTADQLIDMVCSKGGTTIEAMNVLRNSSLNDILQEANAKAIKRAEELAQ